MRDGAFYFCVGGFAIRPEPSRSVLTLDTTWVKSQDGQWRLVAAQVMAILNEHKPIAVSPKKLDECNGQYQLAPDVIYTIMREGDKLFGRRTGRAERRAAYALRRHILQKRCMAWRKGV